MQKTNKMDARGSSVLLVSRWAQSGFSREEDPWRRVFTSVDPFASAPSVHVNNFDPIKPNSPARLCSQGADGAESSFARKRSRHSAANNRTKCTVQCPMYHTSHLPCTIYPMYDILLHMPLAAFFIFLHHIIQNSCRLFFCLLAFSALCRYLFPRLRVVSPVQQLSVPLQHVRCSSCSLSDLASHSSELLSAFFLFVFFVLIFLIFLVWLVMLCSLTGTLAFHLPYLD